jgi:hypothetical protein
MATKIVLRNVRIAFAHGIWKPTKSDDGTEKFNCAFLFEKDSPINAQIEAAMLEAAENKWPGKGKAMYDALKAQGRVALYNGDLKSQYAGYEGRNYVNASNVKRPPVRDRDGKTPLVESDGIVYSGAIVNGIVEFWGLDSPKYGKRMCCSLMGVQKVADSESFAGGTVASDTDFEELTEGSDADDLV